MEGRYSARLSHSYRLFTAYVRPRALARILARYFPAGYTLMRASGSWHGTHESSAVIDVAETNSRAVDSAARAIKRELSQRAVMIEREPDARMI